ncbi:hypothetical protein [Actinomadura kijaniata]|uniref:hypothetical protein n=1 Tax=Actinomadura kijaniata TaxID=46161 RepID=UPI0012F89F7E|nr:hypothetical protein [Actinomadura kijaniata]
MSDAMPRHVLCVLGSGLDLAEMERTAAGFGGFVLDREYSETEPDPRMPDAFEASMAAVSFEQADRDAVESHDTVGYLLSAPMMRELSVDTSRRLLAATAALLRSGATAVKNESSGIAHGRDRWLALADEAADAEAEDLAAALVAAWVKRPIYDGRVLYSCGMHLLGAPEVEIEADEGRLTQDGLPDLVCHLDALAIYLLTDPRAAEIEDGAGFRLTEDAPRRLLRTGPCDRYDEDDLFFNPYGYVRLTRPEQ